MMKNFNKILDEAAKKLKKDLAKAYIKKIENEWVIFSESGKRLGSYKTKKEAEDRLKQIEMFKHMKDKHETSI